MKKGEIYSHMTFEEYKRHFEIFAKLDTPEKIAICERQYRDYATAMEFGNFFEPWEETEKRCPNEKDISDIFNFNKIKKDQILFLIQPSFEPEALLSIVKLNDNYDIQYSILKHKFNSNKHISEIAMVLSKGCLSQDVGDQIFMFVEHSMKEARKSESRFRVVDGVRYKIAKIIGEQCVVVFKHSPDQDSKPGKIIRLLEAVVRLTASNSNAHKEIESLLSLI